MKMALLGLSVIALAGCNQDDMLVNNKGGQLTGVVEQGIATKSYSNESGEFKWDAGDNVSIFLTSGNSGSFEELEMVGGENTDVATYGAYAGGTPKDVAVFPVSAAKSYSTKSKVLKITYPSVYENANLTTDYDNESNHMEVNDPMVALFKGIPSQLVFRHVGGVIEWRVVVPALADELTVTMNNNITGDFTVDQTNTNAPTVTSTESTANNTVSFKFTPNTEGKVMHFYMPIPTGTYKGMTLSLKNNGKEIGTASSEATNTVKRCDWIVMPIIGMGLTGVIEQNVSNADDLVAAALNGGAVTLQKDIVLTEQVVVPAGKSFVIDLNGHTISNNTDFWDETAGNEVYSLLSAQGGTLVVTGDGSVKAKANDCFAVDVYYGGSVVLEGGNYVGNIHAVYVYEGSAEIKGGSYSIQQLQTAVKDAPYDFTLNCRDENYKAGTAKITVTGGTFNKVDPANCKAEGAGTNFLAKGYSTVQNGDDYQVVKGENVVTTTEALVDAINGKAATVTLNAGTYDLSSTNLDLSQGVKIVGNGSPEDTKIIAPTKDYAWSDASKNANVTFENVTLDYSKQYSYSNPLKHAKVTNYTNCNIVGMLQIYASEEAMFKNCYFSKPSADNGYCLYFYAPTKKMVVENCEFVAPEKGILVYNEATEKGSWKADMTISNCSFTATNTTTNKAAVEIHTEKGGMCGTITFTNCTAEGFNQSTMNGGLWNELVNDGGSSLGEKGTKTKFFNIIIDGSTVQTATESGL